MKYAEIKKDIFSIQKPCYYVQCISADFAMGAGIALGFNEHFNMKNKLTAVYPNGYTPTYDNKRMVGDCILMDNVLNLITKEKYWYKPTYQSMEEALIKMREIVLKNNIKNIAMPLIGTGLDKLKWNNVSYLIRKIFNNDDVNIAICRLDIFEKENIETRIAITAHRPGKLPQEFGYDYNNPNWVITKQWIKEKLIKDKCTYALTGMALGGDTVFAEAVLELKAEGYPIKLECAIPCRNHSSKWLTSSQKIYNDILSKADKVTLVTDLEYNSKVMADRNKYLVDALVGKYDKLYALWNEDIKTGTGQCVRIAKDKNIKIDILKPSTIMEYTKNNRPFNLDEIEKLNKGIMLEENSVGWQIGEKLLKYQADIGVKYHYNPFNEADSKNLRIKYSTYLPNYFLKEYKNNNNPLHSKDGMLIADKYDRIVIGDYGAFIEIDEKDIHTENLMVKEKEEYRFSPKYHENIKYEWYRPKTIDAKLYHQLRTVTYADYLPNKWYISPYETLEGKGYIKHEPEMFDRAITDIHHLSDIKAKLNDTPKVMYYDLANDLICFDTETTGLSADKGDELLQISMYDGKNERLSTFMHPYNKKTWNGAMAVNHITPKMVENAPYPIDIAPQVRDLIESAKIITGYNINFDIRFFEKCLGIDFSNKQIIDLCKIFKDYRPSGSHKLRDALLEFCPESLHEYDNGAHFADTDTKATVELFHAMNEKGLIYIEDKSVNVEDKITDVEQLELF